jgi:hypothetical protein
MLVLGPLLQPAGRALAAEPGVDTPAGTESEPPIDDAVRRGIALRRSGDDEAALDLFLDLEKRAPNSVRVLLHVSTAALAVGKWVMAYNYLEKASSHPDDLYYRRHLVVVESLSRTIGERVGRFRVRGTPAGAEVRLNGDLVGTLPMDVGKAVETGAYTLDVSKPGYYPLRRPITVTGHGTLTQEAVELRELKPLPMSSTGPDPTSSAPLVDSARLRAGPRGQWMTWALTGGAVFAAASSGVAFAIREGKVDEWNDNSATAPCLRQTNPTLTRGQIWNGSVRHDIEVAQDVGIAAGIASVGLGGAAFIDWLMTRRGDRSTDSAFERAGCRPAFGAIACSGTF